MNETNLISRIGRWFKPRRQEDLPLVDPTGNDGAIETRGTFLRPWARRDAAIQNLQDGFDTLTDLMGTIKDNLEQQSHRQNELLSYLSHLPQALQGIPESNRVQSETLKAIHQQLEHQHSQQQALADILERISQADDEQNKSLDDMKEQFNRLNQHEQSISENLHNVGSAMQTVSRNSHTSAQVLEQMRDNINKRDGELERIMQRQGNRFTTMLAVAIFLSIAALVAVSVIGYLGYTALQRGQ